MPQGKSPKQSSIAYSIPDLPFGINLTVKWSANAWWMSQSRLHKLLAAFSIDCTIEEACAYTGITIAQYKHFAKLHPEIREIKRGYQVGLTLKSRMVFVRESQENPRMAMKYLEKKRPLEFGPPAKTKLGQMEEFHQNVRSIKLTMTHNLNGIEYTEEEMRSPDFHKLKAERECEDGLQRMEKDRTPEA